ncbi:MAG: PEGA domain-containing protein [Verrucomicrobiota bacterium]|nr:PEGA domain-containing protein [Verrucomicrobiota bacterium]
MNTRNFAVRAGLVLGLLMGTTGLGIAQVKEVVETSSTAPQTQVQTRTYEKDGKLVTEKVTTTQVVETEARSRIAESRKAAIFIANRAGPDFDEKMSALEDLITSRISDLGFTVISREVSLNAVKAFEPATQKPRTVERTTTETSTAANVTGGATAARVDRASQVQGVAVASEQGYRAEGGSIVVAANNGYGAAGAAHTTAGGYQAASGEAIQATDATSATSAQMIATGSTADVTRSTRTVTELAPDYVPGEQLDALLSNNTSALRLAQNLGADYIIVASITSFGQKARSVDTYGVKMNTLENTLRVSYKILDAQQGGSMTGDTIKVSNNSRATANASEVNTDSINELLDDAAEKVADSMRVKNSSGKIRGPEAQAALVTVKFATEAADLVIPDVRIQNNTVTIGEDKYKVTALNVTVEVDGMSVGTAPGAIKVKPGPHKLRLSRDGYKDWERTVNFYDGQTLTVALQLSEQGFARWKDATAFLNDLHNGAKLTDAQVKVLEGQAEMLKQSGYKVDTKDAPATNMIFH